MEDSRLGPALLFAPLAPTLFFVLSLVTQFFVFDNNDSQLASVLFLLFLGAFIAATFALGGMLLVGYPCHLLLTRLGLRGLGWYVVAGMFGGTVLASFIPFGWEAFAEIVSLPAMLFTAGGIGVVRLNIVLGGPLTALGFWVIARPDVPGRAESASE